MDFGCQIILSLCLLSANLVFRYLDLRQIFMEKTPFLFEALDQRLMDLVDFVVPGDCAVRRASTVVDCSTIPISIVRQGAVQLSKDDMKI